MLPTKVDCEKVIYRYTNGIGKLLDFAITLLGEAPLGFLGDHYSLKINYTIKEACKTSYFFLKTIPNRTVSHMEYVKSLGVFQKEALLYKNLLIDFQKYHDDQILPRCFLVKEDRFIVLEDLSIKGFKVHVGDLELEQFECLMRTMAKFHASSVIFEEQRTLMGETYKLSEHNQKELKEATFVNEPGHPRQKWALNTSKAIIDTIKYIPGYTNDGKAGEKLNKIIKHDICDYVKPSKRFRNVITHADLWKNNVMFMNIGNDKLEAILIDFQLARYAPPALDLLTTLYVNSKYEFLKPNFDNLLNIYYEQFAICLTKHNIKPDYILSHIDFMESINYYTLPALIEATMFATIIFVGPQLSNDMINNEKVFEEFTFTDRSTHIIKEIEKNPIFRDRYLNILTQLVQYLDNLEM